MPIEVTPKLLETLSALSELHNTLDDAAVLIGVTPEDLGQLLCDHAEARARWVKGGIEARNQWKTSLNRMALAGSVQAFALLKKWEDETPKKNSPVSSATTATPKKKPAARDGLRWMTLAEQADKYGPSPTYMREAIAHTEHPLDHKTVGGKWAVQPAVTFAWIRDHAGRRPPKLKVPLDHFEDSEPEPPQEPRPQASGETDLIDVLSILKTVDTSGDGESGVELEKLKIAKAEALRRHIDSEIARQKLFKADDVVKMLRTNGDVYCEIIESTAGAMATEFLRIIREKMDVDLTAHFSGAHQVMQQAVCELGNRIVIPALRHNVVNQVEGVQMLEGTA